MKEKYIKSFENLLNNMGINNIDKDIEMSNLYFGISKSLEKYNENNNVFLNSKYVKILNTFYIDNLTLEEKQILENTEIISNEFIKQTIKKVLSKNGVNTVMYNPPMPERNVENGTLVLQLIVGKNTTLLRGEEYINNLKKQDKYLKDIVEKYEMKLQQNLNINCKIFIDRLV